MNILWSVFCCCSFSPIFPTFLCSRIVNARTLMVNHQPNGASTFIVVVGSVKTNCSTGGLCNYDRIAREEATKTCTHIKRTEKYVCVCVSASMKLLHEVAACSSSKQTMLLVPFYFRYFVVVTRFFVVVHICHLFTFANCRFPKN